MGGLGARDDALISPSHPPPFDPFTTRPGFTHVPRIDVALLLTCRRVYLETAFTALEANEHVVWGCEGGHAPQGYKGYLFPPPGTGGGWAVGGFQIGGGGGGGEAKGYKPLKQEQREKVKRVRVFAQQYWLEDFNGRRGGWADFCRSWRGEGATAASTSSLSTTKVKVNPFHRRAGKDGGKRKKSSGQPSPLNSGGDGGVARKGGLEELTVTIRYRDWWHYLLGQHSPMALDPFKAGRAVPADHHSTTRENTSPTTSSIASPSTHVTISTTSTLTTSTTSATSPPPKRKEEGWGTHLRHIPHLKRFTLELEALDAAPSRAELENIVSLASSWRFRVGNGDMLVFDADATRRTYWNVDELKREMSWGAKRAAKEGCGRGVGVFWKKGTEVTKRLDSRRLQKMMVKRMREGEKGGSFYVVVLVWRARKVADVDKEEGGGRQGEVEEGERRGSQVEGGSLSRTTTTSTTASSARTHPAAASGTARAVGRDVIPSYWG